MNLYAVIMAGGVGSRFWPRSRERTPKQLLKIFGDNTMVQETINRLESLIPDERIFIITNKLQSEEIKKQLPNIPVENIIEEPFGRNTAACIGVASLLIQSKDPEAVTVVLPADHIIKDRDVFINILEQAANFADKSDGLVTIGIPPTRPETGYGYIQIDDIEIEAAIHKVLTFAEKPNYATAVRFLESGDFLWNSGMFIWRVNAILDEIRIHMHDLNFELENLKPHCFTESFNDALYNAYGQLRSISIDYGIMEKSKRVFLIKGRFAWSDVGSWEEVYQLSEKNENGNAFMGEVYADMTNDSFIYSPEKFTAVIGLDNIIVINTDDALLVCRRDQSQEVKKVYDYLKHSKTNKYL
jgi:mannose-1-phosphate guanylyltransferase